MILLETETFRAERRSRHLQVAFKLPHSVLSTCPCNGGWREDLEYLVNHQSCEGREHAHHWKLIHELGEAAYHRKVCAGLQLPPERAALLSTAANMQYAATATESDQDLSVTVFTTAGVKGNASRAGDPTRWRENAAGDVLPVDAEAVPIPAGTIHVFMLFNQPLAATALARTAATLVEAKTAVLQELAVPSLYGSGLATGTGTDGFALAAVQHNGTAPRRFAGSHSKLGEIAAQAVMKALREALQWQNGLDPSSTRNLFHALGRFGVREPDLLKALALLLDADGLQLLAANSVALWHEPQLAAAAYALAAVLDRAAYGTLPPASREEALIHPLALLACAVAHKPDLFPDFRQALAAQRIPLHEKTGLQEALARAIGLGWRSKWNPS